jgi:hypothetical protein
MKTRTFILALGTAALAAGSASAADITVTGDITTSQTWTKNNVYKLSGQVYVMPGATLTIEPGTVIASIAGGSLAVTRDARIVADGTKDEPIIFTSETDKATWTASNPQGVWRASALEWGNLTIMGNGYIGKYGNGAPTGNVATPNAANYANMEGLVASGATDTRTRYGGGNDQDDSGTLRYASFRYGGKVVGLGTELNGLSLGGVGQATEIDHVEIMNNVDDGIEIWGGKVDLKYFSIWNIGDDSFDLDHGWRGRAQFGLIVQGYSLNAASGSGVCDSMIEIDGAAKSDAQPVTTVNLYNMTLIGQPLSGKRALKYRDNARMQLNNSIIMNAGEAVVRNDNTDGEATDGQTGYGHNGTHTFAETWTTNYNVYPTVNAGIFGGAAAAGAYSAQVSGKLNQITDTVFYGNTNAAAYTEANARGVFAAANNNVQEPADLPIVSITRGAPQSLTGGVIAPVLSLDPRAAGAAVTSVTQAPNNGFFTPVTYRGAFSPTENWMCGWTAAHAYGYSVVPPGGCATAPACPADLTGDGSVDGQDLGVLLGNWGSNGAGNLNGDASVDGQDLGILLGAWGTCD